MNPPAPVTNIRRPLSSDMLWLAPSTSFEHICDAIPAGGLLRECRADTWAIYGAPQSDPDQQVRRSGSAATPIRTSIASDAIRIPWGGRSLAQSVVRCEVT